MGNQRDSRHYSYVVLKKVNKILKYDMIWFSKEAVMNIIIRLVSDVMPLPPISCDR